MIKYLLSSFILLTAISVSADERASSLQEAIKFYQNQEPEKAFQTFFALLDSYSSDQIPSILPEDSTLYQEALDLYLNESSQNSKDTAIKILQKYTNILVKHPDYYQLGFIVASAYANLNKYAEYFSIFFDSFKQNPSHYMVYKGKAILYIKLLERARTSDMREIYRARVIENANAASLLNPADIALYRVLIAYATPKDKRHYVLHSLNKIIDSPIMTSRTDIGFFVEQAVELQEWKLAQSFIDKARMWYQPSKIVDAAQDYLQQQLRHTEKGKQLG